jgi:eukaryotic-like serine/threonine-protein kinase
MSEKEKLSGIHEASTVIEMQRAPSMTTERRKPQSEDLATAAGQLPSIEVPPHASKVLEGSGPIPRDEKTAPRIGEYALIARFPSSATAEVFLGYKVSNFGFIRRAVVKWTDRNRSDYQRVRGTLLDEGRAISFVDHPNIVTILDLGDDDSGTYIAVEYVAGTDLRRVMAELAERKDRMPYEHACFLTCELLRGLQHMHLAVGADQRPLNIVHRDVNPSNVLISEDGHVKLTDFGTVLMQGRVQGTTAPGMVKGKVRYLAPEYIADQICSHHVDVYSVGVMLFEMLTGQPAFVSSNATASMMQIVRDGLPVRELKAYNTPKELIDIVAKATHKKPQDRFHTAAEMCNAIEDWMNSDGKFVSPSRLSSYLQVHGLYV